MGKQNYATVIKTGRKTSEVLFTGSKTMAIELKDEAVTYLDDYLNGEFKGNKKGFQDHIKAKRLEKKAKAKADKKSKEDK